MDRNNPFRYDAEALQAEACEIRKLIVRMIAKAGSGHPGGSLSMVDVATTLFFNEMVYRPQNPQWEQRDRFVLSKGHCAPALYAIFARNGQIAPQSLWTFSKFGSALQKHSERHRLDCVEVSTGSLGQGISLAAGMALYAKSRKLAWRTYALIGCGECDEGQVWEAAMSAAHFELDNFCAILDYNQLQVDGSNDQVMRLRPVGEKFASFGWNVLDVDGHAIPAILEAFRGARQVKGMPSIIIARTTKGKGVSFMENQAEWHANGINPEQERLALESIGRGA